MCEPGWALRLAVAVCLAALPAVAGAHVLDDTEWAGGPECSIRAIYFYPGYDAAIDFGSEDDYDFGYWWSDFDGAVVGIDFEFYPDTFLATFDGTVLRAAHAAVFPDDPWPLVEYCTFTRTN